MDLAEIRRGPSFQGTKEYPPLEEKSKGLNPSRYYATRLATVVLVRNNGEVVFVERDVWFMDDNLEPKLREAEETPCQRKYQFQIKIKK